MEPEIADHVRDGAEIIGLVEASLTSGRRLKTARSGAAIIETQRFRLNH